MRNWRCIHWLIIWLPCKTIYVVTVKGSESRGGGVRLLTLWKGRLACAQREEKGICMCCNSYIIPEVKPITEYTLFYCAGGDPLGISRKTRKMKRFIQCRVYLYAVFTILKSHESHIKCNLHILQSRCLLFILAYINIRCTVVLIVDVFVFHRMKRKFYSWEECMNLREVKVRMVMLPIAYGTTYNTPSIM